MEVDDLNKDLKSEKTEVDSTKKKNLKKENESCSSFDNKKDLEICLMIKERILSSRNELKEKKFTDKPSSVPVSSLRSSINKKSKIKYLD